MAYVPFTGMNISVMEIAPFLSENSAGSYLAALVIFFAVFFFLVGIKLIITKKLRNAAQKRGFKVDNLFIGFVENIRWQFAFFISLYAASLALVLPRLLERILFYLMFFVGLYYAIKSLFFVIDMMLRYYFKRKEADHSQSLAMRNLIGSLVKVTILIFGVLLLLANLGLDITSLIAGIGIGGIAIAFALQNILEDLFSSFSIHLDKPFEIGDFVIVGDDMGVIEYIGIKTTRIKALQGHEIVITNRELTSTRIHNYKKMKDRRIAFEFGVEYATPQTKLSKIPAIVKELIEKTEKTIFDRCHLKSFRDSSLTYEVVYYVKSSDYNVYMDVQQAINLALVKAFRKEKISFAFPTRKIHLVR